MAIHITLESFLAVLQRSGLIPKDSLEASLKRFKDEGGTTKEARQFAEYLLAQKVLTRWQAEKLLQGKHKGFFLGRYRLLDLLGKGGMSSVYLAEHTLMRRHCAIKVLPAKWAKTDTSYLGRFHREAQAVAALDHPNIVRAYDVDHEVDNDTEIHFLVMEYVEGKNFVDIVAERGPLPIREAVDFIRQAALGVGHAHRAGLVHRDIKPGNLLVDLQGTVKILDLGLAKFFQRDEASLTVQHDERVLGTADYLAPEQAVDSHSVDSRADIYSLGCSLYFLITGHPPFNDGTLAQRLIAHQTKEPPAIEIERQDVPAELLVIIRKMMAKDPNQRYQSADEAGQDLTNWLHGSKSGPTPARTRTGTKPKTSGTDIAQDTPHIRPAKTVTQETNAGEPRRSSHAPEKPRPVTAAQTLDVSDDPLTRAANPESQFDNNGLSDFLAHLDAKARKPDTRESIPSRGHTPGAPNPADLPIGETSDSHAKSVEASPAVGLKETRRELPVFPVAGEAADNQSAGNAVELAEPPARSSSTRFAQRKKHMSWMLPIIAGCAIVAIVLIVVFSGIFGGDDEPTANPGTGPAATGSDGPDQNPDPVDDDGPRPTLGEDITVGPGGHFETISEALDYLKVNLRGGGDVTQNIVVAPGTYADRIVIDNSGRRMIPKGVRIVCNDAAPAVLNPTGPEPVISLEGVEGLVIENFVIEAGERNAAVHLGGYSLGTQLRRLTIQGVSTVGIEAVGASGLDSKKLLLEDIRFIASGTEATGLRCSSGQQDTQWIDIVNCRFLGPMKIGVEFASKTWNVTLRQCIFHQTRTGVSITAIAPDLQGLAFINNTFHAHQRGIVFQDNPQVGSGRFVFTRNLFLDGGVKEIDFEDGFDAELATRLVATPRFNWSERGAPEDLSKELDIFSVDGSRGVEVELMSTDPDDPNFLKPSGPELRQAVTEPADGYDYIGAVAP